MKIQSFSQSQSKIPDQFHGQPVLPQIKQLLILLDERYSMSYGEVEWLLENWYEDFNLLNQSDIFQSQLDNIESKSNLVLKWSRDAKNSLLRITFNQAFDIAKSYFLNQKLQQTFSKRLSILRSLLDENDDFKEVYIQLDQSVDGGLSDEEFNWVYVRSGSQILRDTWRHQMATVIMWSRATRTQMSSIHSSSVAIQLASEWADYPRKKKLSQRLSKGGIKIVHLPGKWKAIWIDTNSVAKPDLHDNVVSIPGGPSETYEYQVEREITGIELGNSNQLISIRDPNGVPQASLAIGDETNDKIEVYEVEGTSEGKTKVLELTNKLARRGQKMWWVGEVEEVSNINELAEVANNPYGFLEPLNLSTIGPIGDNWQTYKEALDWIYNNSFVGGDYSARASKKGIDALSDYAANKKELHMLAVALDYFDSQSMTEVDEQRMHWENEGIIPEHPDSDDEQFNPNGEFDLEAYERAENEYYAAIEPYESALPHNNFYQNVQNAIQERRNAPENKAFYDAIDAQQEEALRLVEMQRAEAERILKEKKEEELAKAKAQKEFEENERMLFKMHNQEPKDVDFIDEELDIFSQFEIGIKKSY